MPHARLEERKRELLRECVTLNLFKLLHLIRQECTSRTRLLTSSESENSETTGVGAPLELGLVDSTLSQDRPSESLLSSELKLQ
jgi:hypothetical protein